MPRHVEAVPRACCRYIQALFKRSHNSLGSREMMVGLPEEGFQAARYKVRNLVKTLKVQVTKSIAYKVATKRNHRDEVADILLNQIFNPVGSNQIETGDYL